MPRICLTGGTGFVGRQILKHLRDQGHKVRLIQRPNWSHKLTAYSDDISSGDIEVVETDDLFSENVDWWKQAFDGVSIVIHSAWYVEPGLYLTSPKNLDCLKGTLTMAQGAKAQSVSRFVGIGTCIEYDINTETLLTTASPYNPTTIYSAAKLSLYQTLSHYFQDNDVSFLWGRLFYLYGEGEDPRRFTAFLHQKMQDGDVADLTKGTQIRDFMNVSDAGKLIVDLSFSGKEGGANICTGHGRTIREIAEEIADNYGRRDLLNFGARAENLVDPEFIVGEPTFP